MMNNRENKKNVNSLKLGDRIGDFGMYFLNRNNTAQQETNSPLSFVDVVCPFCGKKKTLRLNSIVQGNVRSCGCRDGRRHIRKLARDDNGNYIVGTVMLFGWVYLESVGTCRGMEMVKVISIWDPTDIAIMPACELDPEYNPFRMMIHSRWARSYVEMHGVELEALRDFDESEPMAKDNSGRRSTVIVVNGYETKCYGRDEQWIKPLVLNVPDVAPIAKQTAYVHDNHLFGQTDGCIRDRNAKYADLRTLTVIGGEKIDIYEEYDSPYHSYNNPPERDVQVELGCAAANKGLFRISNNCRCIKERDAETFLAIREKALSLIRENIVKNARCSHNVHPTLIRVSTRRGVELGRAVENRIEWFTVATIGEFLA